MFETILQPCECRGDEQGREPRLRSQVAFYQAGPRGRLRSDVQRSGGSVTSQPFQNYHLWTSMRTAGLSTAGTNHASIRTRLAPVAPGALCVPVRLRCCYLSHGVVEANLSASRTCPNVAVTAERFRLGRSLVSMQLEVLVEPRGTGRKLFGSSRVCA